MHRHSSKGKISITDDKIVKVTLSMINQELYRLWYYIYKYHSCKVYLLIIIINVNFNINEYYTCL